MRAKTNSIIFVFLISICDKKGKNRNGADELHQKQRRKSRESCY